MSSSIKTKAGCLCFQLKVLKHILMLRILTYFKNLKSFYFHSYCHRMIGINLVLFLKMGNKRNIHQEIIYKLLIYIYHLWLLLLILSWLGFSSDKIIILILKKSAWFLVNCSLFGFLKRLFKKAFLYALILEILFSVNLLLLRAINLQF